MRTDEIQAFVTRVESAWWTMPREELIIGFQALIDQGLILAGLDNRYYMIAKYLIVLGHCKERKK